jgi:hypothetical protein
MRFLVCAALAAAPLVAQNWYVPNNNPTFSSGCNVIPFGQLVGGPFYQARVQIKASQADLGGLPGLITGLGFAPCGTGSSHFTSLEIVLDHHPAGQPLSTTFAANLTPNAVTVLSASDYTWNTTINTWHEVGLQQPFVYLGSGDLVIQITSVDGTSQPSGFRTESQQRIYWISSVGSPAAVGFADNAALKFEVGMLMARISSHGVGCPGTNGTPTHTTSGTPQIAQAIGFDLTSGRPSGFGVLMLGFYNGTPPFPLELSSYGMPGCFQFHDTASVLFVPLTAAGTGSVPFTIPNDGGLVGVKFYSQFACIDPGANATGVTTSNYNRILIGN